jgi:hypothetical protein
MGLKLLKEAIAKAAEEVLGLCEVYVFGSVVEGRAIGGSDVDVLIIADRYQGICMHAGVCWSGFDFVVPEFNGWFKYKSMVEPLKLAMERGEIKYELHREVIGPYRFSSFFSVNYNVATFGRGYEVTFKIQTLTP